MNNTQMWKEAALRQSAANFSMLYKSADMTGIGQAMSGEPLKDVYPMASKGGMTDAIKAALEAVRAKFSGMSTPGKIGALAAGGVGATALGYGAKKLYDKSKGEGEEEAEKAAFWKQAAINQAVLYTELQKQAGISDQLARAFAALKAAPGQAMSGIQRGAGAVGEAASGVGRAAMAPFRGASAGYGMQDALSQAAEQGGEAFAGPAGIPSKLWDAIKGGGRGMLRAPQDLAGVATDNPYGLAGLAGLTGLGGAAGYGGYRALSGEPEESGIDPQLAALIAQEQAAA